MKLNSEIQVIGRKVILIPYRKIHVKKYHKWMENSDLRKQTASERLTIEEEYAMQQSWMKDEYKCTFIVLDKQLMTETNDEIESMIGDVNLYIHQEGNDLVGEIGLMIAEPNYRSSGKGTEAGLLMLRYGIENIGFQKYTAVISSDNTTSIHLFEKFNFIKEMESKVFQEITLCRTIDTEWISWLTAQTPEYVIQPTEPNN